MTARWPTGEHSRRWAVKAARTTATTWGGWPAVQLEDDSLSVVVVAALGGRVVSLRDRRSGREWLMQGLPPSQDEAARWGREDAVFSGRVSFGWDECLPTVAPCADPLDAGAALLRDHGDQWGRVAQVVADGSDASITTTWSQARWPYRFTRRLVLEPGGVVRVDYTLVSLALQALPILWSMHPTVALEPGSLVELPGVDRMRLTWTSGMPLASADRVAWPLAPTADGVPVDLGRVHAADGSAAKLYGPAPTAARFVAPDGAALEFGWDQSVVPAVGLWLSFGGWPPGGPPVEQVALEPTTSPDDHLADALAHDRAWSLPAGGALRWWVRIVSRPPSESDRCSRFSESSASAGGA